MDSGLELLHWLRECTRVRRCRLDDVQESLHAFRYQVRLGRRPRISWLGQRADGGLRCRWADLRCVHFVSLASCRPSSRPCPFSQAVCNAVTRGLLTNPISGLMGLAFSTLATSGAMPFWQTLASTNAWDEPLMAFHLTRCVAYL